MIKKTKMSILLLLIFILSIGMSFSNFEPNLLDDFNDNLETSSTNFNLFNSKNYTFNLDDFYDDEVMNKTFTGAKFQSEDFNGTDWSGIIDNDTVSPVNNTICKSPSNTDVSMIDGTFDDTDNMKSNDDSYSEFTSIEAVSVPDEFINNIDILDGTYQSGAVSDTWVDNAVAYRVKSLFDFGMYWTTIDLNFDPAEGGRNFLVSAHLTTDGNSAILYMNGGSWKTGVNIDFDDEVYNGLTSIRYTTGDTGYHYANIFYLKIVEIKDPTPADLNFTIDMNFNELDTSDLLAVDVSSHHYTNISATIDGSIYNYDTSSYVGMFSSAITSEAHHYFMNDVIPEDFINSTGNVRLRFNGSHATDCFKMNVDYINITFYYKLDLEHSKAFDTNGDYRYRWEITGSLHYTQWVIFEVIDPAPNFHAISESDITTRWILQNASLTAVEDFHDDIDDYWNLVDTSNPYFNYSVITNGDTRVSESTPTQNFGSVSFSYAQYYTDSRHYTYLSYGFSSLDYFVSNESGNYKIGLYAEATTNQFGNSMDCYNTTSFDEHSITWNTMPSGDTLLDTTYTANGYNGWVYWDVPNTDNYYFIKYQDGTTAVSTFFNKEWGSNKPIFIRENVSKNYFGDDYMYMQTDTTESIGLKSLDYTTHYNLNSGDYFEVDFQTSSDSQIDLILLKDGVVNKTLTLSQSGNTNFNRHTVQLSVDEDVEFDQLKIRSTFEDTDYIKVYDIKTYKYTIAGDFADFYVGSKRDYSVYLTPDIYNLRISEEGDEKINENITIPATGVLQYVYTPIERLECRIALFNTIDESLEFTDYHIKVNRSLNGVYNEFWLLESIFSADKETYAYISIYDRFNTLIDTFERFTSDYIDLELEVYQLQIKNLMEQKTTLDINSSYTYPLLSGDSIYFMLSKEYYQIGYYDSNDNYRQFSIYLDSNQAYELNKSRICFLSYADQQGNHLIFENYKTYLNGSLIYENIFYKEIGEDVNITIKDRYDIQIHSEIYTVVSGDNYIPITLTMYSLKVMSQQLVFNHINITRDSDYYESSMYWSEWVAPSEIIEFRLFAGYYTINITNVEDSSFSLYDYTLNGDDVILISSDNTLYNVLYNIANVNVTLGNQITNVQIDLTNQNSEINNTIVNIVINLENVNSSLGNLLVNLDLGIKNIANNISSLFVFTNNSFLNLDNQINNSFIYLENNIISINQSVSTLIIGLDGKISIVNATINTMWTEMNNQFIVTQSTIDFSFSFLNQTIMQIANNITSNHIALNNLIIQRANEIDNSLIEISTLVNLINSSVVNESLVIQSLVNIIGSNITENHVIINNLINLLGNNITENNLNLVSLIELTANNITTNQFVIQTLIDYVSNNITDNHLELLTNINFINNTIDQNQIELINRLLFINNSINEMALDLTNHIIFINDTIYSAILNVSTSLEFNSDCILGNISLTYQQNDFLTELYKETMFSQLLNFSGVAYNYSIMEDRIDVWDFVNHYRNQSIYVSLRYNDLIQNLTVSAQNTLPQYLPNDGVEYNLWSVKDKKYLDEWKPLPENRTVNLGFYEATIIPEPFDGTILMIVFGAFVIGTVGYLILLRTNLKFQKRNLFSVQKKPMKKVNLNKNLNSKSWKKDLESET